MLLQKAFNGALPPESLAGQRIERWINLGGQIISEPDVKQLISDIENNHLTSWDDIHHRLDQLWAKYPKDKQRHAYQVLCLLSNTPTLSEVQWEEFKQRHSKIQQYIKDQIKITRTKDDNNPFRNMTYWDEEERTAVLG